MNIKSLIIVPFKIGSMIGIAIRFTDGKGHSECLFLPPAIALFWGDQFAPVDQRENVDEDQRFIGRLNEFAALRDQLENPTIGPDAIVQDIAIDETRIPVTVTIRTSRNLQKIYTFDEVAVHGFMAEIYDHRLVLASPSDFV